MPLTQAEINLAIQNRTMIKGMLDSATLDKEEYQSWVDRIAQALDRFEMSDKTPENETVTAESHSEE